MAARWRFAAFMLVSYVAALAFELVASTVGDGRLFEAPAWPAFFLAWYGALYALTYLACRRRPLWVPVLAWAILGPVIEILVFRRLDPVVDPAMYAAMSLVPWLTDRWWYAG
jgi:hypothetical protein